jgi:hypothetical protein
LSPNKRTRNQGRRQRRAGVAALAFVLQACGDGREAGPPDVGGQDAAQEAAADLAGATPRCLPAGGMPVAPRSIPELVRLVNELPQPVTLACFLESLARPLHVQAAHSLISLQPSRLRSPRMFLFSGPLIMTIVPEGKGSNLVEMGQLVGPDRSLKAEVAFPVTRPLTAEDPYARVREGPGTTCRFCHRDEIRADDIGYAEAFVTGALRPADRDRVPLGEVLRERQLCAGGPEPADERCAMLRALFDHGEVVPGEFPTTVPTFTD